eukprot:8355563-Heterocapsa_arctica.AAC.1
MDGPHATATEQLRRSRANLYAPDCKTLSRARDRPIPGARFQPVRLRSKQFPLGLPGLPGPVRAKVVKGNE